MPVYNHYYPDSSNLINTPSSADRLLQEGPTIPVSVGVPAALATVLMSRNMPVPAPVSGVALIDTGATLCTVDQSIMQALNIPPFGTTTIHTGAGPTQCPTYPASLSFPGTPLPNLNFTNFWSAPLQAQGIIAIIGRNVLRHFVVVYNGPGGSISLAY